MLVFFNQKTAYEMRISDWSSDVCSSDLIDAHPFADPLRFRHASGEMIAFRVVPHGPECMRDTRELVLARPTRWRCSPDLESERGGHSAAQPDLLPHPVRIVAVRAACRGIERVNRFVRNKLLEDRTSTRLNSSH